MVFSSTVFLFVFLPVVLGIHFVLPGRLRNAWLLTASLVFYAFGEPEVVGLMVLSILVNWAAALVIDGRRGSRAARAALLAAVVFDLGLLVAFKYLGFLARNLSIILETMGLRGIGVPQIALPIGISFFSFQAMSYVIDVFRGDVRAERGLIPFGMYIALFPQLVAGPIVRYVDIARQVVERTIDRERFADGVRRFVIGLGKKMLVANLAGRAADDIFALPSEQLGGTCAWLGALAYAIQIYFDFSGYSDMAIGLGRMLGFDFLENFRHPYVARSVTDFWRRWHISLSTWFRDYLYIPLGGNRRGPLRTSTNLGVVFLLCGLWHGAAWTFVVWGAWHGAFLVLERIGLNRLLAALPAALRHAFVLMVVLIGWVFFRAESLRQAGDFLTAMSGLRRSGDPAYPVALALDGGVSWALAVGLLGSTPILDRGARWFGRHPSGRDLPTAAFAVARALSLLLHLSILFLAAMELAASTHNPFIYFRF